MVGVGSGASTLSKMWAAVRPGEGADPPVGRDHAAEHAHPAFGSLGIRQLAELARWLGHWRILDALTAIAPVTLWPH